MNEARNELITRDFERVFCVACNAIGAGNNPMVGMTVAVAVAIEEASK